MDSSYRTADPYTDLDVIDHRARRANQAFVGVLSLIGVVSGQWWLLRAGRSFSQLAIGLTLGRRFCLACVALL